MISKLFNVRNQFKGLDKPLLIIPLVLGVISITMMISTSYDNGVHLTDRTVLVQTFSYIIGIILVLILSTMDYEVFKDIEKKLYIGSLIFLLTPYLPFIGVTQNGARSWINLGVTTFQPSEIVKLAFILLVAQYLQRHKNDLRTFSGVFKAFIYAAPFIAVVLSNDLGSALVFMIAWVVMVFYAGIKGKLFGQCAAIIALCVPVAYKFMKPYQKARLTGFLHPDNLTIQGNYQVWQSKVAIGSGGFFGKGLFQGTQKDLDFLPVRNSDFVFSVIVEELGFIGGAIVIALFTWLIYAMSKVAKACRDLYGALIVMGVIGMFVFQIFENIAMTMGLMPVTGITLPFISYGGSSILSNMLAIGLVINVAIKNRGVTF